MDDQVPDSSVSNCKSLLSANQSGTVPLLFIGSRVIEVSEGYKADRYIKERFVSRLAVLGARDTVAAIHQDCHSSVSGKARAKAFQVYSQAVQKKGSGNTANVWYAWYVTSKEEVSKILSYGFGYTRNPENNDLYGCGGYFAPVNHPLERYKNSFSPTAIGVVKRLIMGPRMDLNKTWMRGV